MKKSIPSSSYEYEERAFLDEKSFTRIKEYLDEHNNQKFIDNKQSFFFVMPDVNVSIASSEQETKIKYKGGQLGRGNGFEEIEFKIQPDSLSKAIRLFSSLLSITPQESYQFRINYILNDNVEIALKYTAMWGFHMEVERTYTANSELSIREEKDKSKDALNSFAHKLGFMYINDKQMEEFKVQCERGENRGTYSTSEFKQKYGELFGL